MGNRSIVRIEIPATDTEASGKFYEEVFGWAYHQTTEPVAYTVIRSGNTDGGYSNVGEHNKAGKVVIYIESEDIDADLAKLESLGGTVLMSKMEVPGKGWLG